MKKDLQKGQADISNKIFVGWELPNSIADVGGLHIPYFVP